MTKLYNVAKCVCILSILFACGCEDEPDTDAVGSNFEDNPYQSGERSDLTAGSLVVTPGSDVVISSGGDRLVFVADGGVPPYSWSVGSSTAGTIVEQGSVSAVYQRSPFSDSGDNSLVVADSGGNVVLVAISQPAF